MGLFHGVGLKFSQILTGYSYKLCAVIMPAYLAGKSPLKMEGFVAGLMLTFLLWKSAEYLPVP